MKRWGTPIAVTSLAVATLASVLPASAATVPDPAPPTASITLSTGNGSTLRARLAQNYNGSGYLITINGGGRCSAGYTGYDARFSQAKLTNGWDNSISHGLDYNWCDVQPFDGGSFSQALTGYVHYGDVLGKYVGDSANDKTSSLYLS